MQMCQHIVSTTYIGFCLSSYQLRICPFGRTADADARVAAAAKQAADAERNAAATLAASQEAARKVELETRRTEAVARQAEEAVAGAAALGACVIY